MQGQEQQVKRKSRALLHALPAKDCLPRTLGCRRSPSPHLLYTLSQNKLSMDMPLQLYPPQLPGVKLAASDAGVCRPWSDNDSGPEWCTIPRDISSSQRPIAFETPGQCMNQPQARGEPASWCMHSLPLEGISQSPLTKSLFTLQLSSMVIYIGYWENAQPDKS